MRIERMTLEDVPVILRLGSTVDAFEVAEGDRFWSRQQLEAWVTGDEDALLVARGRTGIVGFALSVLHKATGKATLENLYVLPQYRQQGRGSMLVEELLAQLKQRGAIYVCLCTQTERLDEISFFQSCGFEKGHNFAWLGQHI